MIKGVFLDIDGTLLNSNDAHARAWVEALTEQGIHVDYSTVREKIGMGGDNLLPAVSGIADDSALGKRVQGRRGEIFRSEYLHSLKAFPGTRELLLKFREMGLQLIAATSASAQDLKGLLDQAGVSDLIDNAVTGSDVEHSKPDPDVLLEALRQSGLQAGEVIFLGDTPYDISSGRKAGIKSIAFTCGGWPREALIGAEAIYEGPRDLIRTLEESSVFDTSPWTEKLASGF